MKGLSIRMRLTLWYAILFMGLTSAMGAILLWQVHRHLLHNADRALAEEIGELFEEMALVENQEEMVAELERRFSTHSHYHFQILDEHLNKTFTSRFLTNIQLPPGQPPGLMRGKQYSDVDLGRAGRFRLLDLAVRDSSSTPLLLRAISPLKPVEQDFRSYVKIIATLGPLAVVAALLAGYLVSGHLLSPIQQITNKARKISGDRLDERLPIVNEHDELGELSTTLNETFDRLESSVNTMRRFTSDAAHELRSPVAVLRTEAEIALRKPRDADEYRAVVERTLTEAIRLGELVDQLLTLSRHDAGVQKMSTDEVPVGAIVEDVVARLAATAADKGVHLESVNLPTDFVAGHDVWLSQLFFNLIDNAIKFTAAGGKVNISGASSCDHVEFFVEDTGIGMAEEHLPHVFERFYRADGSREHYRGTGLGLSICKSIVEAHGGEINVESERGEGTRFIVCLPRLNSDHIATPQTIDRSVLENVPNQATVR
ncbi:MAG: HAMP domain-containing protein [Planctomycetales bacterium]|nr:HAMP domain-containing protein [Planctomycetales bacterium]